MGVMTCPVPVGERQGCSAMRMWRNACNTLVAPDADEAWQQVVDTSPPDTLWHSLRNCVAYQAGVWQNLLNKGIDDVIQPAAFKLAIVLRHTPTELTVRLLSDMLRLHPQSQDLTSYILALLTDDEAVWSGCSSNASSSPASPESSDENPQADDEESEPTIESDNEAEAVPVPDDPTEKAKSIPRPDSPDVSGQPDSATADCDDRQQNPDSASGNVEPDSVEPDSVETLDNEDEESDHPPRPSTPSGPAPLRDLRLFGDCELAVLAASREEYDAHAKLVRAEYSKLSQQNYVELRIKVLNQFNQIPKLFHTPEFECFEAAARENIEREIDALREHLLTGRKD